MNALVIVDMQSAFAATNRPETIAECKRLILEAKSSKDIIIVLEYGGFGETIPEIADAIGKYDLFYCRIKYFNDGSDCVKEILDNGIDEVTPYNIDEIKVCGVNTDACVYETCRGLATKGYKVNVVRSACNASTKNNPWNFYVQKSIPNLKATPDFPTIMKIKGKMSEDFKTLLWTLAYILPSFFAVLIIKIIVNPNLYDLFLYFSGVLAATSATLLFCVFLIPEIKKFLTYRSKRARLLASVKLNS